MHFSKHLLKRLEIKGVDFAEVTLHVGLGTFNPVEVEDLSKHKMDSEEIIVTQEACDIVNNAKAKNNRQKMLQTYFSPYFKNSNDIVKAFMQSDPRMAEKMYAAANFENYKAIDQFSGILMINFAQEKTTYFDWHNFCRKFRINFKVT